MIDLRYLIKLFYLQIITSVSLNNNRYAVVLGYFNINAFGLSKCKDASHILRSIYT